MELDYARIGKRIARCRKKHHMTQAKLAELTDVSDQYISNIECARSIPSTETIMRLAIALDTTPDEFLVGTAYPEGKRWRGLAELLRTMDERHLDIAESFLVLLSEQP